MSKVYWIFMMISVVGASIIVSQFKGDLKAMVDFATKISFVVAPLMAWLNLKLVCSDHMKDEHKPSKNYILYSKAALILMFLFTGYYLKTVLF